MLDEEEEIDLKIEDKLGRIREIEAQLDTLNSEMIQLESEIEELRSKTTWDIVP